MSDLRTAEADSIRAFVQSAADDGYLSGRVLDYGCGKQPYRDIVEAAGGEYHGWDLIEFPGNVSGEDITPGVPLVERFDAVLCTQVLQYVPRVDEVLEAMYGMAPLLVLTYPTNWPEVEPVDLWRFTKLGMTTLLEGAGFTIIRHDWRHGFRHKGISFTVGYGVIARA